MEKVVGVRFSATGKMYYFSPGTLPIAKGDAVVVETARGLECGHTVTSIREVPEDELVKPLKPVKRLATEADLKRLEENKKKEKDAYAVCQKKIAAHKLEMDLTEVECAFDGSKIIFYFTADGRVDFRELVKDLAGVFHTRIELRQIGVRDESKMLGGLGICGRPFCCSTFLNDFHSVSIKMAKEQGLSLSPGKISGTCGRLMCCLKYEQPAYEYLAKITPKKGTLVDTPEGRGKVTEVALVAGKVKVQLDNMPDGAPVTFTRDEVRPLRTAKPADKSAKPAGKAPAADAEPKN